MLLHHLDISIVEAEKRINGPLTLKEYYSVYLIETKYVLYYCYFTSSPSIVKQSFISNRATSKNWRGGLSPTGSVWRRYSEFELLRFQLENKYPEAIIPPLPEKKASFTRQSQSSDNIDPVFVDRRRVGLEVFHQILFKIFLKLFKNNYLELPLTRCRPSYFMPRPSLAQVSSVRSRMVRSRCECRWWEICSAGRVQIEIHQHRFEVEKKRWSHRRNTSLQFRITGIFFSSGKAYRCFVGHATFVLLL